MQFPGSGVLTLVCEQAALVAVQKLELRVDPFRFDCRLTPAGLACTEESPEMRGAVGGADPLGGRLADALVRCRRALVGMFGYRYDSCLPEERVLGDPRGPGRGPGRPPHPKDTCIHR